MLKKLVVDSGEEEIQEQAPGDDQEGDEEEAWILFLFLLFLFCINKERQCLN